MKLGKFEIDGKKLFMVFLLVLGIILAFGLADYFSHSLNEEYSVPSYYFKNKIIFGTVIGLAAYLITARRKWWLRALVFSASVSILLQIRYYLEGYPLDFVFLFLGIHFLILLGITSLAFVLVKNRLNGVWKKQNL